jgi:CRP-like cAMP-binding protein
MKLGISYNLFDGEELLEGSIKQIRQHVDYVSVVYQTISNFGNTCSPELIRLLEKLKSEGLIDE